MEVKGALHRNVLLVYFVCAVLLLCRPAFSTYIDPLGKKEVEDDRVKRLLDDFTCAWATTESSSALLSNGMTTKRE